MTESNTNYNLRNNKGSVIKVIGIGGGGGNALNFMYRQGIHDVDFVICNTDSQALETSPVPNKVQLGSSLTEGRGAGNRPEVGKQAALENIDDVKQVLSENTKMVFITAGMGGGTGTGGAPVIAEACSNEGFLTVGIVTIPFRNEGKRRFNQAIEGIALLENHVDALLVINNERIREMYGDFGISEAFSKADNVLATAAKGIAEIITVPGYINVDFADVETVMRKSGLALMGTGIASGKDRAAQAVEQALSSPLLNNSDIRGAKNILLNITSGNQEVTMDEVGTITDFLQNRAGFEADLIWGNGKDENLNDEISVTLIATGFGKSSIAAITGEKTLEIETVKLNVEPVSTHVIPKIHKPFTSVQEDTNQREIEFIDVDSQEDDGLELEILYPQPVEEKKSSKKDLNLDFTSVSEEDLDEWEKTPAYKRRQLRMNDPKIKKEFSNYSITNENKIADKNSYLHGQVD